MGWVRRTNSNHRIARRAGRFVETLEPRRLLAATVTLQPGGTLLVEGTDANDTFQIITDIDEGDGNTVLITDQNVDQQWAYPRAQVNLVLFETYGGNDALVYFGYGNIPPVTFHGGAGTNYLDVEHGEYVFTEDAAVGNESLFVHTFMRTKVRFETSQHLAGLHVDDRVTVSLTPGGNKSITTPYLDTIGRLDLADGSLIWTYNPSEESPLPTATSMASWARDGGYWYGIEGIASSSVGTPGLHAVGVGEASDVLNISGSQTALFAGQTVDATTVLVRFTYTGDADLNGKLDADDYFRIDAGMARQTPGWSNGDFNYDERIDSDDYFLIDSAYPAAHPPLGTLAAPAASEIPATATHDLASAHRALLDELS